MVLLLLNNLYENESFIKFIENDTNLEEIMDDICIKIRHYYRKI